MEEIVDSHPFRRLSWICRDSSREKTGCPQSLGTVDVTGSLICPILLVRIALPSSFLAWRLYWRFMALAATYLGFGKMEKRMRENLQMLARPPQTIAKETE